MLILLSPAKALDFEPRGVEVETTVPTLTARTKELSKTTAKLTASDLKGLMGISDDLADLNRERFKAFDPSTSEGRPAAMVFNGEVYRGLDAPSMSEDDFDWAQDHLRILSGLYGVLRPLDGIQPYRLEMGTRLNTRRGKNLYDYWGADPAKALKKQAKAAGTDVLVNCASQEYFGAVDQGKLGLRIITPTFLEEKNGKRAIVSFFAKQARGSMARFIITRRVTDPEGLKDFDLGGYAYDAEASTPDQPVFVRAPE